MYLNTYEVELAECIKTSNIKGNRSSKDGISPGSYFLAKGFDAIVTACGGLATIAVVAGSILRSSLIFVVKVTEDFRDVVILRTASREEDKSFCSMMQKKR